MKTLVVLRWDGDSESSRRLRALGLWYARTGSLSIATAFCIAEIISSSASFTLGRDSYYPTTCPFQSSNMVGMPGHLEGLESGHFDGTKRLEPGKGRTGSLCTVRTPLFVRDLNLCQSNNSVKDFEGCRS